MQTAQKKHQKEQTSQTPLLDRVAVPADLRALDDKDLKTLAEELRQETIDVVSKTGGHLGASLGVVELTLALHAVFDTPRDRLIWDVGHQAYPHKIITGRRDRMHTLRQGGGLSGFTKRSESEYDPFGAAHSSTSISAGLGMAVARDLKHRGHNDSLCPPCHVICVIGDGAMSAGMAYEAMNNAGSMKSRLIVILNDNDMSIARPVGALSRHLTKIVSSRSYMAARETGKKITEILPPPLRHAAKRAEESARMALGAGTLFEELGFYYIGPVDGHNLDHLLPILRNLKDSKHEGPVLIHAVTQKGKGYAPAETARDKMHGVAKFDIVTGSQQKPKSLRPAYTDVFASALINEARKDNKILSITAAMPGGTGLDKFGYEFPERMFDVGIAEQHAVTFAAGLAAEGYKPFVAIYSTFLQRAYDQIVHDVALQNLPVRFAIDRAGLVGADGATHAGAFDIAYLGCLPNMVLMAAADEAELARMVATAAGYNEGPIAFRYPRGEGPGTEIPANPEPLEIGKGRIVHSSHPDFYDVSSRRKPESGNHSSPDQPDSCFRRNDSNKESIALLSYGAPLSDCLAAAALLEAKGHKVTVADARFAKPLDEDLISHLASHHSHLITVEHGSTGGFGSYVLEYAANNELFEHTRIRTIHLPDRFQDQDAPDRQYEAAELTARDIAKSSLT